MKIIVDTREQRPWQFPADVEIERRALPAGDYAPAGLESGANGCVIERKSLNDLLGSILSGRERLEKELAKLAICRRAVIVVEASLVGDVLGARYRSKVSPNVVLASIASFGARFNVQTIWAGDAAGAARLALAILSKWDKHCRPIETAGAA